MVSQKVWNFSCTESMQSLDLLPGRYRLEAWGASGGISYSDQTAYGGNGGYVAGELVLVEPSTIYIYVGGKGNDGRPVSGYSYGGWNGGGRGSQYGNSSECGSGGGGGTDFRIDGINLNNRILVAGGGGGGGEDGERGGDGGAFDSGNSGVLWQGTNLNATDSGGGGGGGYYGGSASYESSGRGGSNYTGSLTNSVKEIGINSGDGRARITLISSTFCLIQDANKVFVINSTFDGLTYLCNFENLREDHFTNYGFAQPLVTEAVLDLLSDDARLLIIEQNLNTGLSIIANPRGDIVYDNFDIEIPLFKGIEHVQFNIIKSENDIIRFLASPDGGNHWYTYRQDRWESLSSSSLEVVRELGLSLADIQSLSRQEWDRLITNERKIRFAYYIEQDEFVYSTKINKVNVELYSCCTLITKTSADTQGMHTIQDIKINGSIPGSSELFFLVSFDNKQTWYTLYETNWLKVSTDHIFKLGMPANLIQNITASRWQDQFVPGTFDLAIGILGTESSIPIIEDITMNGINENRGMSSWEIMSIPKGAWDEIFQNDHIEIHYATEGNAVVRSVTVNKIEENQGEILSSPIAGEYKDPIEVIETSLPFLTIVGYGTERDYIIPIGAREGEIVSSLKFGTFNDMQTDPEVMEVLPQYTETSSLLHLKHRGVVYKSVAGVLDLTPTINEVTEEFPWIPPQSPMDQIFRNVISYVKGNQYGFLRENVQFSNLYVSPYIGAAESISDVVFSDLGNNLIAAYRTDMDFHGSSPLVALGTTEINPGLITVELWVNRTNSATNQALVRKYRSWALALHGNTISYAVYPGYSYISTGVTLELNTPTQIVWTYNGSETKLYKNGVEVYSAPFVGYLNQDYPSDVCYLGYDQYYGWKWYGNLYLTKIYNRALLPEDVAAAYEGGVAGVSGGVPYADQTIYDFTGIDPILPSKYIITDGTAIKLNTQFELISNEQPLPGGELQLITTSIPYHEYDYIEKILHMENSITICTIPEPQIIFTERDFNILQSATLDTVTIRGSGLNQIKVLVSLDQGASWYSFNNEWKLVDPNIVEDFAQAMSVEQMNMIDYQIWDQLTLDNAEQIRFAFCMIPQSSSDNLNLTTLMISQVKVCRVTTSDSTQLTTVNCSSIYKVTVNGFEQNGTGLKHLVSFDDRKTWWVYKNTQWQQVRPDMGRIEGMTSAQMENILPHTWGEMTKDSFDVMTFMKNAPGRFAGLKYLQVDIIGVPPGKKLRQLEAGSLSLRYETPLELVEDTIEPFDANTAEWPQFYGGILSSVRTGKLQYFADIVTDIIEIVEWPNLIKTRGRIEGGVIAGDYSKYQSVLMWFM